MNREKVLIQPSPTHSRPTRASSESGCGADHIRTANAAAQAEMRLSAAICTANMAGMADGEWALISPYGDHASPDGSYTQSFEKLLAEITDVRTGEGGLEGRVTWNARGATKRASGALYPSPLWWHWPPSGEPPAVFPELLESVGLVATPNISSVPAWTQNGAFDPSSNLASQSQAENQETKTANIMDRNKILTLLGLAADATDEQLDAALKGAGTTANALQTASARV